MDKDMMVRATCPLDLLVYQERSSHATYVHCSGHCLNLVINLMLYPRYKIYLINCMKACSLFLKIALNKVLDLLQFIIYYRLKDHPTKCKTLLQLCKTCWVERH